MRIHPHIHAGRRMRRKVSVTIDQTIYEKAHALGINVSKVSENALLAIIEAIEQAKGNKQPSSVHAFQEKRVEWTGRDLNPRLLDCESNQKPTVSELPLPDGFYEWLVKDNAHKSYVARYMFAYAGRFQHCLDEGNLDELLKLQAGKCRLVMASLSALAKFTGRYEAWRGLVKQYSLKWSGKSKDDVFIDRMTSIQDPEEIWQWIISVKKKLPDLTDFADLMAISGLRFGEAVNSYNLIIRLAASEGLKLVLNGNGKSKVSGYFNMEKSTLEHFWFPELFLRRTKKAFISFVPFELVDRISKAAPLNLYGVQTAVKRVLPLRFSDVREAQGSFMVKFLKEPEIEFIHGRVTGSVFMANYFNPALIADLRERVFKGIVEIQEKVQI